MQLIQPTFCEHGRCARPASGRNNGRYFCAEHSPLPKPAPTKFLDAKRLAQARDLARLYEAEEGRTGTAMMILVLVDEIETLREAFKGAMVIVNQASSSATLAQLKASALLTVAQKVHPVIDQEIEDRKISGNAEDWSALQALSDELHAATRLAKG